MVDYGPSPSEIESKAKEIIKAAVKVKGEKELRMIPLDHVDNKTFAGRHWESFGQIVPKLKDGAPAGIDENGLYRGTAADWQELENEFSWIPETFKSHLSADPTKFGELLNHSQTMTKGMVNVERPPDPQEKPSNTPQAGSLAKGTGAVDAPIELTKGYLSDWTGAFANGFQSYLSTIPPITRRQDAIAQTLYHGAVAARDTYAAARVLLGKIADETRNSIEGVAVGSNVGKGKNGIIIGFGIIAAAATILAGVATVGTALPLLTTAAAGGWTMIAGATSGISAGANLLSDDEKPKDIDLAASTVNGVIEKMNEALTGHQDTIDKMEKKFKETYDKNIQVIDANSISDGDATENNAFFPARPNMLDMGTSQRDLNDPHSGFTHPSSAK